MAVLSLRFRSFTSILPLFSASVTLCVFSAYLGLLGVNLFVKKMLNRSVTGERYAELLQTHLLPFATRTFGDMNN